MSTVPPVKQRDGQAASVSVDRPLARIPAEGGRSPRSPALAPTGAVDSVPRAFIQQLHCPYCGSGLELRDPFPADQQDVSYGLLRCACHEYPILKGIILLQQRSPYFPGDVERAIRHLKAGEHEQALMSALWLPPMHDHRWLHTLAGLRVPRTGRLIQHLREQRLRSVLYDSSLSFHQAAMRLRAPSYAQYLFQRHANTSFLAAMMLNSLFHDTFGGAGSPDGTVVTRPASRFAPRVLDIGAGVCHNSFHLADLCPAVDIVACDCDFTNLYIARRFLIPDQICIGLDLEMPMPFPDGHFDAVLCSDAFHYVRSKAALVRELDRVLEEQGLWLFSHMHNSLVENASPGMPLAPWEYQRLLGIVDGRLIPEMDMLRRFSRDRVLNFTDFSSEESLRSAHAFEWVGGRDPGRWRKRIENVTFPVSTASSLGINPIYEIRDNGDRLDCRLAWPDPVFEAECGAVKEFLPEHYTLDKSLLSRIAQATTTPDDAEQLQHLLRSFVLVHLPPGYGHVEISDMVNVD